MTDPLHGKNVIILGLARQGTALAHWLCDNGAKVTVSDMRTADKLAGPLKELEGLPITYVFGEHPLYLLNSADLLCLSGGVPVDAPFVQEAVKRGVKLSNDAQLFLERCPCHVIGITGSAGKTTTTTLVGRMCEAADMLPWVGGNIGNPLIGDLPHVRPTDIVVMELSSFQLEIMTASPHVAAILNLTPNHLDRHHTMEAYVEAKAHILDNQLVGDMAVLNRDDPTTYALRDRVRQEVATFSGQYPADVGAWLMVDKLMCRPTFTTPMEVVCNVDEIPLRGHHNVMNVLAACAIAGVADVPVEAMRAAILTFEPVEHRLEVVRTWMDVTFVNDSIATAPERVIAALDAYRDEPVVLLLGGRDKKLPWGDLAKLAVERCRAIITFGEAGRMIAEAMAAERTAQGCAIPIEQASTMEDAVTLSAQMATDGDVVLLSPGGTSFDAYEDFTVRGAAFRKLVGRL